MHHETHIWLSPALGQNMEIRLYGHFGQPILVFPQQEGRVWDWEGLGGMIEACAPLIGAGRVKFICVDGIDGQSWTNPGIPAPARVRRHGEYEDYVMNEVLPFVRGNTGLDTLWVTGCSMGAFHAANVFFRHPDVFSGVIGLSGIYQVGAYVGGEGGLEAYYHSPLWYLRHLTDPWYLDRYRSNRLAFVVGQGRWEDECLRDTRELEAVLNAKGVPAIVDYWGYDVDHDWPWWRRMLPHYLERWL